LCKELPVEFRLQDYRDLNEEFDHIVSLGMLEHVGYKNYRTYMEVARQCLKDNGLFLLHTIGQDHYTKVTDAWLDKYIFQGSLIPPRSILSEAMEDLFVVEDWHNFGPDYDKTLMAWYENFNTNWGKFEKQYGERFYRMWKYYLLLSAGSFRARTNQLWQIVLSKDGI
ncbi:class I SAM-dependent methyltransferase, partial [Streptococcus pseudopneumoniae]|uniref:class I SAM-dependent methyltransferase n=1 Tax=Streptococcus pseudopneumoniae TaxID=257758 RepID=UPI00110C2C43